MASLEPRDLIGRIYVGDPYTLLHTQYISCASHVFRELIGRIYVVDHYTLLHTKYISSGPHGFREDDFLSCSHYKSMGANDPQSMANLDPKGMVGRIYVGDHLTSLHT